MSTSANILSMQKAIVNYILAHMPKETNKAHIGKVSGGRVVIDNKSFSYVPAVDMYFGDGDKVACILPEQTNSAVVVGVP